MRRDISHVKPWLVVRPLTLSEALLDPLCNLGHSRPPLPATSHDVVRSEDHMGSNSSRTAKMLVPAMLYESVQYRQRMRKRYKSLI